MLWYSLQEVYQISKPKSWWILLWLYVLGMLFALISIWKSGSSDYLQVLSISSVLFLIYFSFPANLLLHAIDYLYMEVDGRWSQDMLTIPKLGLLTWIWVTTLPFLLFFILPNPASYLSFLLWIIITILYHIPISKIKKTIFLDSLVLWLIYYLPFLLGYFISDVTAFSWPAILGGYAWFVSIINLLLLHNKWPMYDLFGKWWVLIYNIFHIVIWGLLLYIDLWYMSIIWFFTLISCSIWRYFIRK